MRPTGGGIKISSSARGILRSSSLGHSNLSLQQVIHRIVGGGQQQPSVNTSSGAEIPSALKTTRARSFSLSDVTNKPSFESVGSSRAKSPRVIINLKDLPSKSPEQTAAQSKGRREGTPESDAGYVTSANSTSPDYSLAELVRAMKLGNNNPAPAPVAQNQEDPSVVNYSKSRSKLPSISELDPAVSHAVKSYGDVYRPAQSYHYQNHSPNLLDTLFANTAQQQQHAATHFSLAQVGAASLLSDRQHINSLFATHPSDPPSLERAAKLYRK